MPHLLSMERLSADEILALLDCAQQLQNDPDMLARLQLTDNVISLLFCEKSTRTRLSFELAAKKLSATVLHLDADQSALQKGESLLDTLQTLAALGVNQVVLRHSESGIVAAMADEIGGQMRLINAGDGTHQHPTQALTDMLTIQQNKSEFAGLSVAIVGDLQHSRVARSQVQALAALGVTDIRAIAPASLQFAEALPVEQFTDLSTGLAEVDVVITLRLQAERLEASSQQQATEAAQAFQLTPAMLALAKPDAIVMHPGPVIRDLEIASSVVDGEQAKILQQVRNGVAVRMAVLAQQS